MTKVCVMQGILSLVTLIHTHLSYTRARKQNMDLLKNCVQHIYIQSSLGNSKMDNLTITTYPLPLSPLH